MPKPAQRDAVSINRTPASAKTQIPVSAAAFNLSKDTAFSSAALTALSAFKRLHTRVLADEYARYKGTKFQCDETLTPNSASTIGNIMRLNTTFALDDIENLIKIAAHANQASEVPQGRVAEAQAALDRFRQNFYDDGDFLSIEKFVLSTKVPGFSNAQQPIPTTEEAMQALSEAALEMQLKIAVSTAGGMQEFSTQSLAATCANANLRGFIETIRADVAPRIFKNEFGHFVFNPNTDSPSFAAYQEQFALSTFLPNAELLPQLISFSLFTLRKHVSAGSPQLQVLKAFINSPQAQKLLVPSPASVQP